MNFDIRTLAFVLCLVYVIQALALFIQYKLIDQQKGILWWFYGTLLIAIGFILMLFVRVKSLMFIALLANPFLILGYLALYIGMQKFFNWHKKKVQVSMIFGLFLLLYSYFLFIQNNTSGRTMVVSVTIGLICVMTASVLYARHEKALAFSARFTSMIFMFHGLFMIFRGFMSLSYAPVTSYTDLPLVHELAFVIPIVTGSLWTYGLIIMINQRLNTVSEKENEKFQLIFNLSPDAALISRLEDSMFIDVNEGFLEMFGYSRQELLGNAHIIKKLWSNLEDRPAYMETLLNEGHCKNLEISFKRRNGNVFTALVSSHVMTLNDEAHIIDIVRDISESKMAIEILHESEETYRSILFASPDDITITDMKGNILMASQAATKLFGYERDEQTLLEMNYLDLIVSDDRTRAFNNMRSIHMDEPSKPNEYLGIRKDGSILNIEVNSGIVRDSSGKPSKMIFVIRDITERKVAEEQINELVIQLQIERNAARFNAITDSMTGLFNRRYFDDSLYNEFYRLKRTGAPLSLIMLDVDHFKAYNDTYGHIAGDECLKKLGAVLMSIIGRVPDVVARYGGEEFIVILPETKQEGANSLAENIRHAVEALRIPHSTSDTAAIITVSLGVTTVYTNHYETPEQVVALADAALYSAKQNGRNQVYFGSPALKITSKIGG